MNIDLKQLRELLKVTRQFDISELEIAEDGARIVIKRNTSMTTSVSAPSVMHAGGTVITTHGSEVPHAPVLPSSVPPRPSMQPLVTPAPTQVDPSALFITSPFVGTFYRSPSPEASPYVVVGDEVRAGQVLCIVEAMKLMNEIEAEFACEIAEVLVENGTPVEYGEPLFRVRRTS